MVFGYDQVPNRFLRRTSEDDDENGNNVPYSRDNNDDSGTVPHERIHGLLGCEQANVLHQNSRLGQKQSGGVEDLRDPEPLADIQSTI